MHAAEVLCVSVRGRALPDDLGAEVFVAEDLVEEGAGEVADVRGEVQEQRAAVAEQLPDEDEPLVEHLQVGLDALAPRVAVGLFLDHRGDLGKVLVGASVPDGDADLVVLTGVERRVDVDKVDLPGQLVGQAG